MPDALRSLWRSDAAAVLHSFWDVTAYAPHDPDVFLM